MKGCNQNADRRCVARVISLLALALLPFPVVGGEFAIPAAWQPQLMAGRNLWIEMPFYENYQRFFALSGMDREPFYRDAALRVNWDVMLQPDSPLYRQLLALPNPVVLRSGYHQFDDAMLSLDVETYRRFERDFAGRFVGIHGIHERMGALIWGRPLNDVLNEIARKTGQPVGPPHTRNQVYSVMSLQYRALTQKPLLYRVYATTASPVDHFLFQQGAALSSCELSYWVPCAPLQLAAARGAGRQYGKPWGVAVAAWGKGIVGDSHNMYDVLWPGGRRTEACLGYMDEGPNSGASVSLQKRMLYAAAMAGANLVMHESDCNYEANPASPKTEVKSIFVANYDPQTIDTVDPLVRVLRDPPHLLSPVGSVVKELHEQVLLRHDRGVPYTPVGIVVDRHHGMSFAYSGNSILNSGVPYEPGDFMNRALVNTIWPWENVPGGSLKGHPLVNGPFGDLFDVITSDAPVATLRSYRALVLSGGIEINSDFAARLKNYVDAGGTLVANVAQLSEHLPAAYFGCTPSGTTGTCQRTRMAAANVVITEPVAFPFAEVTLTTGDAMALADNVARRPLVVTQRHGAGTALLTLAYWAMPSKATSEMVRVFAEILRRLTSEASPVEVAGDVEYLVNRNQRGWVVTLLNNRGVTKPPGEAVVIDHKADTRVRICLKSSAAPRGVAGSIEWLQNAQLASEPTDLGTAVSLTVPAGDVRIVEFVNGNQHTSKWE